VAHLPTVYITASDQHRNGKTLLARLLVDYLMLDGLDPFLIDTDVPEGPLRSYFPGRTLLADFASMQGRMKVFDTILASPGRDYVIDLPQRHTMPFFQAVKDLSFFAETKAQGFRIFVLFIVDIDRASARAAHETQEIKNIDLFVPVHNHFVGTSWPHDEGAFDLPNLDGEIVPEVLNRRFSFRSFVQGDKQNLPDQMHLKLNQFLYDILQNLSNLEPMTSLKGLRGS
jgi:hypothetical protein